MPSSSLARWVTCHVYNTMLPVLVWWRHCPGVRCRQYKNVTSPSRGYEVPPTSDEQAKKSGSSY